LGVVSLLVFPKLSRVDNDYDNFINDTLEQNFSPPNLGNLYISENLILNKYYDYSPV
jgi:hypothetical protein